MGLKKYFIEIDDEYAEDGEELGIFEIANTENPAIQIKGVYFSKHEKKTLHFADELKCRIAAPVLTPSEIYRKDEDTGEEYDVVITPEIIEKIYLKFMRDRAGKDIFNDEHDEAKRVPAYILETWLVENPKKDKSYTSYGIEVPVGSWFAVQQFTDKEAYKQYVSEGKIGFSIHGETALRLSKHVKKINMKKRKFIAKMSEAQETDGGEIIVTADTDLTIGVEVAVLDADLQPMEDFSGEVVVDDVTIVITNDEVTEVKEEGAESTEVEMTDEEKAEKEKIEASEEEEKKEKVEATEEEKTESATYSKDEVDAKFQGVIEMIASLKADKEIEAEEEKEEEEVQLTGVALKMHKLEKLNKFSKNQNKK